MLWALKRHDRRNYLNFLPHLDLARRRRRCLDRRRLHRRRHAAGDLGRWRWRSIAWRPRSTSGCPGLGASTTEDWDVEGVHMAERCGLFVIIALGESILVTGATFAGLTWTPAHVGAFLVAFAGSVAMWGSISTSAPNAPARRSPSPTIPAASRAAATPICTSRSWPASSSRRWPTNSCCTIPTVTPNWRPRPRSSAVRRSISLGNALFKRLSASRVPLSHLVGLGLLALLVPVAPFVSPLILASGATLVLILVPVWEWRSLRHTADVPPPADNLERE